MVLFGGVGTISLLWFNKSASSGSKKEGPGPGKTIFRGRSAFRIDFFDVLIQQVKLSKNSFCLSDLANSEKGFRNQA